MDDGGEKCEVGELCMWWRVLFCPFFVFFASAPFFPTVYLPI